jgi:hypothetical protein
VDSINAVKRRNGEPQMAKCPRWNVWSQLHDEKKTKNKIAKDQLPETTAPLQLGMVKPDLRFRLTSNSPQWSSHA